MLQGLLYLLGQMDPLWVLSTIVIGTVLGIASSDLEFEWKTVYLLFFFYLPFTVARVVAFLLAGAPAVAGTGVLGILFFTLYAVVFIIGRYIGRNH